MDFFWYFYVFLTAMFFALLLVPMLRRWAVETGQLDMPDRRKSHVQPTPRLGGVGIFTAFLFSVLVFSPMGQEMRGIIAGALVVFVTGLVDDLYGLSAKKKFFGQISACFITVVTGNLYLSRLGNLFGLGEIVLPWWIGIPFTIFAVVGVINALNLLDGLDGLAGGFSFIALAAFALLGWQDGNLQVTVLSVALLGGVVGFLKYNSYPATIFMGDAGSLSLGFFLGFLALLMTQQPTAGVQPIVPFVILGLPIVDTIRVMLKRLLLLRSPFTPDRTHVHHRFLDLGLNHRFTVIAIYGLTLVWTILALVFRFGSEPILFGTYLGSVGAFYFLLRIAICNKEHLAFFKKDSARSLRESRAYVFLMKWSNHSVLLLFALFLGYLAAAVSFPLVIGKEMAVLCFVSLIASAVVYLVFRDYNHPASWVCLYLGISLISFNATQIEGGQIWGALSGRSAVDMFFLAAAIIVSLKLVFKKPKEKFLTTSVEILLVGLVLAIIVLAPELRSADSLPSLMSRMVILLFAFKILAARSKTIRKVLFFTMQGVLLTLVYRGF